MRFLRSAGHHPDVVTTPLNDRIADKLKVQVGILVVNCSLFNPTPSLSAMIVNHFKMKSNIITYNLSGMGCSAGVIAVNLAKELLQVHILPGLSDPAYCSAVIFVLVLQTTEGLSNESAMCVWCE